MSKADEFLTQSEELELPAPTKQALGGYAEIRAHAIRGLYWRAYVVDFGWVARQDRGSLRWQPLRWKDGGFVEVRGQLPELARLLTERTADIAVPDLWAW